MKPILLLSFILALSLVSSYYAGETIVFTNPLPSENLIWTIIDNTTELTVMPEVNYNLTNITVHFPSDMPPTSFTIVFLEEQTRTVIQEVSVSQSGGRGGGTNQVIIKNQTQYIEVPNYIDREVEKIVYVNQTQEPINNSEQSNPNENYHKRPTYVWIGFILLITGLFIFFLIRRYVKNNREVSDYGEELNIYGDTE